MSNPLVDLITRGESGAAGYNAYNRGMYKDEKGAHFRGPDKNLDLTQLTIGQVQDLQYEDPKAPDRLFAVGKYQIIPDTLHEAIKKLRIDRDARFSPELQDDIFSNYLIVHKRPAIYGYITGKAGSSIEAAQHDLAKEWASFGDPEKDGKTHFLPPNHASITLGQSADALNQMRAGFQACLDRGLSHDAAWQAITNFTPSYARSAQPRITGSLQFRALGDAGSELQDNFVELGYTDNHGRVSQVDKHYSPSTEAVVRAFQEGHGLHNDEAAGPRTLEAMRRESVVSDVAPPFAPELDGRLLTKPSLYAQSTQGLSFFQRLDHMLAAANRGDWEQFGKHTESMANMTSGQQLWAHTVQMAGMQDQMMQQQQQHQEQMQQLQHAMQTQQSMNQGPMLVR